MSSKSELASFLDEAIVPIRAVLARHGFRARNRTFNRRMDDGIIHVVQVVMGRSDPPGARQMPGFGSDLYGTFSVELGVYVPEVARQYGMKAKTFPGEIDCCVRINAAEVGPNGEALAWPIKREATFFNAVADLLEHYAMPFLQRYSDRPSIVNELKDGRASGPGGAPRVVAAVILANAGDRDGARGLLQEQDGLDVHPFHRRYLRELAEELQLGW